MSFTEGQLVDIRRFCGYPAYAYFGWVFEEDYATLTLRLQHMSAEEEAVVTTKFLPVLAELETAVIGASCRLGTDAAAVWTRNKNEVADRTSLYYDKRRELCSFIGVIPGRGLRQGGRVIRA